MNDNKSISPISYKLANGEIPFNMTNDYMFRVILQKHTIVLKGLICALLHLKPENIQSANITNPIELGEDIDDKTFVLDIDVMLNNDAILNLEMQMSNERNWQDRSLSYLCRSFDQLYQGESYSAAKPALHIGFLNFHPFPDYPEFYATYKLMNLKNGMVYSDKFSLSVVDLTCIELATNEDKEYQLDAWAKFFTSTTWEEVIMITEHHPHMEAAAQALYEANADEMTKRKCRARRDYYKQVNTREKMLLELSETIGQRNIELEQLNTELKQKDTELELKNTELEQKDAELEQKDAELEQKDAELEQKDAELEQKDARIKELEALLAIQSNK